MTHRLSPPGAPGGSARLAAVVEEARKGHALADTVMQLLVERAWALPESALHEIGQGLEAIARKARTLSLDEGFDSSAAAELHEATTRLDALSRRCAEVLAYVERLQRGERLARRGSDQATAFSRAS